jgi:uncharacterized protein (DUF1778 family)
MRRTTPMDMKAPRKAVKPRAITRPRPDTTINLRVSRMARDEIDSAASLLGKTRTDFIVESARKHATDVLLDRRLFSLDTVQHNAFLKALDKPAPPNARLKRLMASKPQWEK